MTAKWAQSGRWIGRLATALLVLLAMTHWLAFAIAQADSPTPAIPAATIPARVFTVKNFGAIGDGKAVETVAIQKAIDAASQAGGGKVVVPAGTFLTGPLTLCSNLDLHLDDGAVVQMSEKIADYPLARARYRDCITASDCHDISITGNGTIDGQGGVWWPMYKRQPGSPAATGERDAAAATQAAPAALPHRPNMIVLNNCRRVLVRDVTLKNSPNFHLVPQHCRDVVIDGIHIQAPSNSPNTDGIDPSGWNFLITRCTIDVGDDCIAIKPSGTGPLRPAADSLSCEDFTITHCTFLHGHGMSIGNPTAGGLRRLRVGDCTFDGTEAGIRMKSHRGAGNVVEEMTYENLAMKNVKVAILITSYYPSIPASPKDDPAAPAGADTPVWRNIRIRNVTATGSTQAGRIIGLPEMHVSDVVMENVQIEAKKGMEIVNADGVKFVNSKVTAASGPALTASHADVTGLE